VWQFIKSVEDVHKFLRYDPTARHFDLALWHDGTYNIYSSGIVLKTLKPLGGEERGRGAYQGKGMRFDPRHEGFLPFTEFEDRLRK